MSRMIRRKGRIYIYYLLPLAGILVFMATEHEELFSRLQQNPIGTGFAVFIPVFLFLYLLKRFLDRRALLVIEQNGIWIRDNGQYNWNELKEFKLSTRISRITRHYIEFLLTKGEMVVELDITDSDSSFEEIQNVIVHYSGGMVKPREGEIRRC